MSHNNNGKSNGNRAGEKIPLRKYLDDLLDSLRDLIPQAIAGDEDAVHDARVATRRLKAATDLLKPVLPDKVLKSFRRTLKNLRQCLGDLRDADVMIDHSRKWLAEVKKENRGRGNSAKNEKSHAAHAAAHETALKWLIAQLQEQRNCALRSVASDINASRELSKLGKWWGLRSELAGKRANIEDLLSESLQRQFKDFAGQAEALCQRTLDKPAGHSHGGHEASGASLPGASAGAAHEQQDPHALRIAGKLLRYTLEMAAAEDWPLPDSVAKSFKQVQQALGLWHDWVVLAEEVMRQSVQTEVALHDIPLQRHLLSLSQAALRRAEMQLSVMSRLWRRRGADLREAIFRVLPKGSDSEDKKRQQEPASNPQPQESPPPEDPASDVALSEQSAADADRPVPAESLEIPVAAGLIESEQNATEKTQ